MEGTLENSHEEKERLGRRRGRIKKSRDESSDDAISVLIRRQRCQNRAVQTQEIARG